MLAKWMQKSFLALLCLYTDWGEMLPTPMALAMGERKWPQTPPVEV